MKKIAFIIILSSLSCFALAVPERPERARKESYKVIEIYETAELDKPFKIIGKANAKSSTFGGLAERMRGIAYRKGGNVVLMYKVSNSASVSWWTGAQLSYAEGVIVKYDPKGIRKITPGMKIPVLY